ncbi:hypothetical protein C7B61_21385 [filamentous cyanobacterium CCP1]|nr:hypothetical protein C7B76_16620 [filamentous cyanobacterium CCP2]PSB55392.1 hypothetical protein C7B61_21385 [filamentous cyanobacterium CCP1]
MIYKVPKEFGELVRILKEDDFRWYGQLNSGQEIKYRILLCLSVLSLQLCISVELPNALIADGNSESLTFRRIVIF